MFPFCRGIIDTTDALNPLSVPVPELNVVSTLPDGFILTMKFGVDPL